MSQKLSLSVFLPVFWGLSVFLVGQFSPLFGAGRVPLIVYYAHLVAAPLLFFVCGFFSAAVLRHAVLSAVAAVAVYMLYMPVVLAGQYGFRIALLRFDAVCGAGMAGCLTVVLYAAALRLQPPQPPQPDGSA